MEIALTHVHSFDLAAPADDVWACLSDPGILASCIPGFRVEREDGLSVRGQIRLKLGPVPTVGTVEARLSPLGDGSRTITIVGSGTNRRTGRGMRTRLRVALTSSAQGNSQCEISAGFGASPAFDDRELSQVQALIDRLIPQFAGALEQRADEWEAPEERALIEPALEGVTQSVPPSPSQPSPLRRLTIAGATVIIALALGWRILSRSRSTRKP